MTKLRLMAFIWIVSSSLSWAQTESDTIQAARLNLAEKLYEAGEPNYRGALANKGRTPAEVDTLLSAAFDDLAACLVTAAQDQARDQGIPERIVLKSISDMVNDEEAKLLAELDWRALHAREKQCSAAFEKRMAADSATRR